MKFPAFAYAVPETIEEALELLASDADARPLAGGQSLLPIMALRLAAPSMLVDLGRIDMLRQCVVGPDRMRIGAMRTHAANAACFDVWAQLPLMSDALHHVAHQAVRNRGTFGGSLAHADAGAEMPLVVSALDGAIILRGPHGERSVPAADFFQGHYTTAIEPGELLVAVELPYSPLQWAFEEFARRSGDLAVAMAAVGVDLDGDVCRDVRILLGSVGERPIRAHDAEAFLRGRPLTPGAITEAGRMAVAGVAARSDIHADPAYRASIAAVLVSRALDRLARGDF
ncbi:xanthine dehydrogenase family protein subunit M [Sphingomonas histidinilytica]|uniref:Carbon-monoxide dehydrogenase medium subunit n=1 Tax=Rhizorhabdus histidinilytica TaxID=439228 RepID=A0A1T5CZZ2_9SPHN|nr:xanthine dehydrogenase family protein subunit M [Rhizorhabdus histidinilytica]MBO9376372.1 xanthine dehydrogenase family protein subunit M [Rhizorhabdus histidinilytica]QEH79173.1 xanthine dehydrogenase family protein subunit M [Sphingomonas sp. C8-2]SKB65045.1 carbon-monoxide dehydrogenase medium subunit [Rhizorhabdus histidinilytica]